MVDRQQRLVEFVTAWAEYEMRLISIGSETKKLLVNNPSLLQMVSRITDDLASSPEHQRSLAMQLAIAEISKSS